jgi:hypothetical protein
VEAPTTKLSSAILLACELPFLLLPLSDFPSS